METEKKLKKKIKIRILPFLIFLCFLGLLALLIVFLCSLPITNIYIQGNTLLKDQELIELAGISDYPSFLKTTAWSMKKRVEASPYIVKAKVKRRIWGQVIIEVEEAKPLFIDLENNLVLSTGEAIPNEKNIVAATLINYTPDTKYESLIQKLTKMKDSIRKKISEIKYEPTAQDKDRFALLMNDGNLVYVTLTKFKKIDYYNTIIGDFPCQKGILNLDSGNHFEIKEDTCS